MVEMVVIGGVSVGYVRSNADFPTAGFRRKKNGGGVKGKKKIWRLSEH